MSYDAFPQEPEEPASQPINPMTWFVGGAILLVIAILAGAALGSGLKGNAAPDFTGQTVDRGVIALADYRGKVVVLDFWATWCGPCIANVPKMKQFQAAYAEKGVEVIGISGDMNDRVLGDFERDQAMNFPTIFDGARDIMAQYKVSALPTLVVIDREGKIREIGHGLDLEKVVEPLI
jgi:peroxiredoxin